MATGATVARGATLDAPADFSMWGGSMAAWNWRCARARRVQRLVACGVMAAAYSALEAGAACQWGRVPWDVGRTNDTIE